MNGVHPVMTSSRSAWFAAQLALSLLLIMAVYMPDAPHTYATAAFVRGSQVLILNDFERVRIDASILEATLSAGSVGNPAVTTVLLKVVPEVGLFQTANKVCTSDEAQVLRQSFSLLLW